MALLSNPTKEDLLDKVRLALSKHIIKDLAVDGELKVIELEDETLDKVGKLDLYVKEKFRVAFGNRIMKQLKTFVPVFVACGGNELEGLDYLLATKVFRKFEALNTSLIRDEIRGLILFMDNLFGKETMKESINYLQRLQKSY